MALRFPEQKLPFIGRQSSDRDIPRDRSARIPRFTFKIILSDPFLNFDSDSDYKELKSRNKDNEFDESPLPWEARKSVARAFCREMIQSRRQEQRKWQSHCEQNDFYRDQYDCTKRDLFNDFIKNFSSYTNFSVLRSRIIL